MYVVVAALLIFGVYAFLALTGFEKRLMTRKTYRLAEDLYPAYGDQRRKRRWLGPDPRRFHSAVVCMPGPGPGAFSPI
jgi:hypothetical protein